MQNRFLLAASYFFLGFIHPWFVVLISAISSINYLAAYAMTRWPHRKKSALVTAVCVSLAILAIFKYANFFLENVNALLNFVGLSTFAGPVSILLPVGISFYTFQALAYTVDVYRSEVDAQKNFIDFSLFIAFFPQLVAGPIERSRNLMPQVIRSRHVQPEMISHALLLLVWGFFKKLVIADNAGLLTYKVFSLTDPGFYLVWAGVFTFAIQILADFWSYTDIARGSALLLGFRLSRNFDHPYFADSPSDFWRRWHMTLSRFLKEYIYIPLGGNRNGEFRTYTNLVITFLIGGIWHGAGWTFVFWGLLHGIAIVIHRAWSQMGMRMYALLAWFVTFNFINITWVFFRAKEWDDAIKVLKGMFGGSLILPPTLQEQLDFLSHKGVSFSNYWLNSVTRDPYTLWWLAGAMLVVVAFKNSNQITNNLKPNFLTALYAAILFLISASSLSKLSEFLYFNF